MRDAKATVAKSMSLGHGSRLVAVRRAFATRRASTGGKGIGARSRAPIPSLPSIAVAALLALSVFCASVATASADTKIGESPSYPFSSHAGGLGYNLSGGIAVSEKEGGDVYFLNGESLQRVDEFHPDGTWSRAFGFGVVPGAATGTGNLAVGSGTISNVKTTSGSFSMGGAGGKIITGPGIPPDTTIISVTSNSLVLSKQAEASGTEVSLSATAGPGNIPTNEVQKLVVSATGGSFKLEFTSPDPGGSTETTPAIAFNASAASIQASLESLSNIGPGNVSVEGGPGDGTGTTPYLITFKGPLADTNVRPISTVESSLSGGSPTSEAAVTTLTQGGGVPETCTTVCGFPSAEEGSFEFSGEGRPGSFNYSDEMAIDNEPGPTYGDVYVADQRNYRVEKFGPAGEFLLMFGGEVDKGPNHVGDICTAEYLEEGERCGAGVPGTGPSHFYEGSYPQSWGISGNQSIAVGPGGTVYVGDYGRVQEFEPDGEYAGELSLPDGGEPKFVSSLAVDSNGNIFERSATSNDGGGFLNEVPGVREYDSIHAFVRSLDTEAGSEPTHIAVNDAGELFVSDNNAGEFEFKSFKPNGTLSAVFKSDLVGSSAGVSAQRKAGGIAIGNALSRLYAASGDFDGGYVAAIPLPVYGAPAVTEESFGNVEPTTATLSGVVNPSGFETTYRFQYVDQASYETEGGFASPHTQVTSPHSLDYVNRQDPVVEAISGLVPGKTYHYRIVAQNSEGTTNGPSEVFESLTPFSVRNLTTQVVGPDFVKLTGELNANGAETTYTVQIGRTLSYGDGSIEGSLPIGNEFTEKTFQFPGLEPNTEYHYRIVGENQYGSYSTPDQTLTTELSAAEEHETESCSNTNLREESNSLKLADCRAYEQISAVRKEGGQVFGNFDLSPEGDHALYISNGAFSGAAADPLAVYYLAHRTSAGWVTVPASSRPAGLGYQPGEQLSMTPGMDRWLFSEQLGSNASHLDSSELFYSMGFDSGSATAKVTPTLTAVDGGGVETEMAAQSTDLHRVLLFSSKQLLASDPQGNGHRRLYEIADVGGANPQLSLLLETPSGLTDQSCAVDDFLNPNSPSASHQTYARSQQVLSANNLTMIYTMPFEVAAGGKCGPGTETEGRPNQYGLFAQEGAHAPVQVNVPFAGACSAPSPCFGSAIKTPLYDGVSTDGKRVWFTTTQPLVNEDTDQTNDLYMARLENGAVVELVLASAGKGTPSHPTPGHGADLGEEGIDNVLVPYATNQGVVRVSPTGTTAAFESEEVLTTEPNGLGQAAIQHANNIYTYNVSTGETRFVTDVCSGPGLTGTEQANRKKSSLTYSVTEYPALNVKDPACPSSIEPFVNYNGPQSGNDVELWFGNDASGEATFSPNGRFLFFTSYGRLTSDDTDNVKDLFRFDTETGQLIRLSFGRNGNDANGNDESEVKFEFGLAGVGGPALAQEAAGDGERKITTDGSIAIFETASPLVSRDTNGKNDIYEWEEDGRGTCTEAGGCVNLISDGVDPHGARAGLISSSGNDITFQTLRSEVPQDTDVVGDLYDARVNGGFHASHPPAECGSPDACRPPAEAEPSPPAVSTPNFIGPGNAKEQLQCAKGRHRAKRHGQVRCVPNRQKKKHGKRQNHRNQNQHNKRQHEGASDRAASTNRGGNK